MFSQSKSTYSDKLFVIQKKLNYNMRYVPYAKIDLSLSHFATCIKYDVHNINGM